MNTTIHTETNERHIMRNLLALKPGQFVGVTFRKINGDVRRMSCRVKDTDQTKKYLTVYDMNSRGYRRVNLDCIMSVRMAGIEFKVQ
ncbi:hypothetical protein [Ottowia sp.]|jgi:hypothetical protein|uniref:hypothetical protein n=1 Tax=Ottowia sp. TaxID=1898956 RepID=UPI0025FD48A7|nr:hypothetical protein [Ottowia sp.]MBK6612687.1 hypothetical protein [Ottowia sp.]